MNIRGVVETQLTQRSQPGQPVNGNAQFALFMSLFNQPGPATLEAEDTFVQHEPHAVVRPTQFSHSIANNPTANIALIKALGEEPLASGPAYQLDVIETLEHQINTRV
ncbi:hypothetical protein [Marinomonas epiphytica]